MKRNLTIFFLLIVIFRLVIVLNGQQNVIRQYRADERKRRREAAKRNERFVVANAKAKARENAKLAGMTPEQRIDYHVKKKEREMQRPSWSRFAPEHMRTDDWYEHNG